ncbi:MAG: cellobiose phosphorylase [Candidatus Omnitrophota bacterium]
MKEKLKEKTVKYGLNEKGEFVVENYNFSKPFANFFPGIAGKYGIPMWVFYVNRGQAIVSFGTKDKDHAILEFYPANKAWQMVSSNGFRTFIKLFDAKKFLFYEPFHNGLANLDFNLSNRMFIRSYGLALEEWNSTLGLKTHVEYYNIPNDSYAGLVRAVTIKNLSRKPKSLQLLDGLPQVVPFGTSNLFLKKLSRTIEAWMKVENLERGVPFYKLDVDPTDRPEVIHIQEGNFYLGFQYQKDKAQILKAIVDPQCIFGAGSDFTCPRKFLSVKDFPRPAGEITRSKMPCAFLLLDMKLGPSQEKTFYSVIGYMRNKASLNASLSKITSVNYLSAKAQENKSVIEELQQDIFTCSNSREFNLYARSTYLDNIMRGGWPLTFDSGSVFYLYSRKHGDLERDYNKFQLQPTYFSQGNGHYRDTNQNRRCDIWFHPEIQDDNLIYFFSLLQSDGFNPLVIKGVRFMLKEGAEPAAFLKGLLDEKQILKMDAFLKDPFTPGDVILFLEENRIRPGCSLDKFLDTVMAHSLKIQEAEHGEGFWTDHWTYNLDLLESYLKLYPEKFYEVFFEKRVFTFFDNAEVVKPRHEKYILKDSLIRQLAAVASDHAKREMIKKRVLHPHAVRTQYGDKEIYRTTLINKLLCLLANKLASLDPFGCGIEMEANKPNWFDALNGLPAIFGSSSCETFELKRLALMIAGALEKNNSDLIYVTEEVLQFLKELDVLLKANLTNGSSQKDYEYWDKSATLKEDYRYKTKFGFSGHEASCSRKELKDIMGRAIKKLDSGLRKAWDEKQKIYYSYFYHEVVEYDIVHGHFVNPKKFRQKKVPFFLEGQMHALRLSPTTKQAKQLYQATKKSPLYDKKLKMYKVTTSLQGMPEEIGRCRVFTPGWLENESIWLHMEYKYILEVLKKGLYKEFFDEFKNVLIPFQDPKTYGRSILENSSFLVSSVFPDKSLHGNGFVARLSGSTAEFLEIWLRMNIGPNPFFINDRQELNLKFAPALAGWLFSKKDNRYSFNFLGKILVVYHNPKRKNTFPAKGARIKKIIFNDENGQPVKIDSDTVPHPFAQQIRSQRVRRLDILLL